MSDAERALSVTVSRAAPAWFSAMVDKTWKAIGKGTGETGTGGSTLAQAVYSPGAPDNVAPNLFAYSGAVVDQSRAEFIAWGGGHTARNGNEPYAMRLLDATPGWTYLCSPSAGAYTGGNTYAGHNGAGQYDADYGNSGAPQSAHTYSKMVYANDRLWLPGLAGMQYATGDVNRSTSRVFSYARVEARWRAHGYGMTDAQAGEYASTFNEETTAAYIASDDTIWTNYTSGGTSAAPTLACFDANNGQLLQVVTASQSLGWGEKVVATNIPGTRYVLLRGYFNSNHQGLFLWSAASPSAAVYLNKLTVTDNSGGLNWSGNGSQVLGQVWHSATGGLILGNGNSATVYTLKPNAAGVYTGAWTLNAVSAAGSNTVTPSNSTGYAYGRFNIVNDMGDGCSALVSLADNGQSSPVYVYRLPASGL